MARWGTPKGAMLVQRSTSIKTASVYVKLRFKIRNINVRKAGIAKERLTKNDGPKVEESRRRLDPIRLELWSECPGDELGKAT